MLTVRADDLMPCREWIEPIEITLRQTRLRGRKATEGMPKDAFADDVPDDIDRHGRVSLNPTHVPYRISTEDI
jgi:hypothetical protein